ncbi:MAG: ABC transporter ATP-binding protein [Methanomicrobium sp.]|nr:ABC transporter ATP-binding protein [Methanomicrobium sp.]MBO4522335.1 ABC transporter ATP-binding protein [Methanomicrobium sp.]MBR6011099.1 ABC transporter ATP-binding protein [Methanomicrobium sp.]MBR6497503.1 ABC transporter ATP-binding protein [Methanomicrobium sp.]
MIHARSIIKDYGNFRALDGVDFDIEEPGIFGIIGHNGAGKTTLLKIMSGLIPATSGELNINGVDVINNPDGLKEQMGYLPEESRLYENMTAQAYLTFFGEVYSMKPEEIHSRTKELFRKLNLEVGDKKLGELSKGMKRKVAIARSLLHDPSLLVYDEPTSGLDPMTSRYISEFLRELRNERKKTILLSAHNLYQVEELCDRVLILQRGKTAAFGTMAELRENFGSVYYEVDFVAEDKGVFDGIITEYSEAAGVISAKVNDIDSLNSLTQAVTAGGGRIKKIESHYPSLEDLLVKIGR